VVFEALQDYDLRESRVTRVLMALRGYGRRVRRPQRPEGLVASLAGAGFVPLGGRPGCELVFGLIGKFWKPGGGLQRVSSDEFVAFHEEGFAKVAWNVAVEPAGDSGSVLTTETRVLCFGAPARRRFRIYWATIERFSGLIRMAMLRGIRRRALLPKGD
jgi:hypothetical protein